MNSKLPNGSKSKILFRKKIPPLHWTLLEERWVNYSEKEKFFCLLANVSSFSLARTHMLEISAENWKKPLITRRAPQKLRPSKKETANILHCFNSKD